MRGEFQDLLAMPLRLRHWLAEAFFASATIFLVSTGDPKEARVSMC